MPQNERGNVGSLGEDLAVRYLKSKGLCLIDRNYRKKWSEIDIIAQSSRGIHFIEVKALRVDSGGNYLRPEENAHTEKLRKVVRGIETYLLEKKIPITTHWQMDVVAVEIDSGRKIAKIRYIEAVSLE